MIDPIAKLHSPTGSLISLYVKRRPPATRAAIVDLLRTVRGTRSINDKSLRVDADRILELAPQIESGTAPAVAIFASHRDCIFEFLPLTHSVVDTVSLGTRPYLRPLRAQPRPMRAGVMVADSSRARTYLIAGGGIHEIGDELTAERGKENYGGFSGYEEQRNRARADEVSTQLWRQAGRRLLEAHQDQPLELLVIAGHEEDFDPIAAELHTYLRRLPQGRITVDIGTLSASELTELVSGPLQDERTRRSEELIEHLLAEAARGGEAVTGLSPVLRACNAHAIERMVVAGPFSKPGVTCDECGWLGRSEPECQVCGATTFEVADVVASAMDATVEAGGKVDIVTVASRLDADGVGAVLRFRLG